MAIRSHLFQHCPAQGFSKCFKKNLSLLISIDNARAESVNVLETALLENEY